MAIQLPAQGLSAAGTGSAGKRRNPLQPVERSADTHTAITAVLPQERSSSAVSPRTSQPVQNKQLPLGLEATEQDVWSYTKFITESEVIRAL